MRPSPNYEGQRWAYVHVISRLVNRLLFYLLRPFNLQNSPHRFSASNIQPSTHFQFTARLHTTKLQAGILPMAYLCINPCNSDLTRYLRDNRHIHIYMCILIEMCIFTYFLYAQTFLQDKLYS